MKTLTKKTSTGEVKSVNMIPQPILKSGQNFLRTTQPWKSTCSSCDTHDVTITYVFVLPSGKKLVQECEDCMIEHF